MSNYEHACNVLGLSLTPAPANAEIRAAYHNLALKYHPDKNGGQPSAKFLEIKGAYETLTMSSPQKNATYADILREFMSGFVKECSIVNIIMNIIKNHDSIILDNVDKYVGLHIYTILAKNRELFELDDDFLCKIKTKLMDKFSSCETYELNPSIDDLLDGSIYVLKLSHGTYYVPLWHDELTFKKLGDDDAEIHAQCDDIIVKCIPELSADILYNINTQTLTKKMSLKLTNDLLQKDAHFEINIGKMLLKYPMAKLQLTKRQLITFVGIGVPICNIGDICSIHKRGQIIVDLTLEV